MSASERATVPWSIKRVVFPTDLGPGSDAALAHAWAIALGAARVTHDVTLTVAHTVGAGQSAEWRALPTPREMLERWGVLAPDASLEAYHRLGTRVEMLAWAGSADSNLTDQLGGEAPDLLVLTTHPRHGVDRLLHPSIAEGIARHALCPTLFLPSGAGAFVDAATGAVRLRHVLVPVAREDGQQEAVDRLAGLLTLCGGGPTQIVLLHVGERSGFPDLDLPAHQDWSYVNECRSGPVVQEILRCAHERRVDLIVMATRGRDGLRDLLRGSTTERVMRDSPAPVLALP